MKSVKYCKVVEDFTIIDTVENIGLTYGTTNCQEIYRKEYGEEFMGICLTRVKDCKGKITYVLAREQLGEPFVTSVSCKNSPPSFGNTKCILY